MVTLTYCEVFIFVGLALLLLIIGMFVGKEIATDGLVNDLELLKHHLYISNEVESKSVQRKIEAIIDFYKKPRKAVKQNDRGKTNG